MIKVPNFSVFALTCERVTSFLLSEVALYLFCTHKLMSEIQLFCTERHETCEPGTSRSVQKLMSEAPLLHTETCDGCERNSPLIQKTYDFCLCEPCTFLSLL
jgi:hypothetical protein